MTACLQSPDLQLSDWGPYGKELVGLSHVADALAGHRWDCVLLPGFHRRAVIAPYGMRENRWHWWYAAPDLSSYTLRYELEWKDRVTVDLTVDRGSGANPLLRARAVNRTELPQVLDLHLACTLTLNPLAGCEVTLPDGAVWVSALDYRKVEMAGAAHRLSQVADARLPGQVLHPRAVSGKAVGGAFFNSLGDVLEFPLQLEFPVPDAVLLIRFHRWTAGHAPFKLSGVVEASIQLDQCAEDFMLHRVELGDLSAGLHCLRMESLGGEPIIIDGFAIVPSPAVGELSFTRLAQPPEPEAQWDPHARALRVAYCGLPAPYSIYLRTPNQSVQIRRVHGSDIGATISQRANDFHHADWRGEGSGYFNVMSIGPLALEPGEEREVVWQIALNDAALDAVPVNVGPEAEEEGFPGMRMLAATTAANVVYPVHFRDEWIRHYTPGRCWDSLYSWDSGMIGVGLAVLDPRRSIDALATYLLPEGDPYAAWVEHGTPLPTQVYQLLEIWNRTRDTEVLRWAYPRLRQFYEWLAGRSRNSTTDRFASGLLQTWDYFYNSGGWDDYPPQWQLKEDPQTRGRVAPAVTTAHAIRFAKTLWRISRMLGDEERAAGYLLDVRRWSDALQHHSWDEESGYFSYVVHSADGEVQGLLRHASGVNFNCGLDGVSPLIAGELTNGQLERLTGHLFDAKQLWTPFGISTVDQSAPYYSQSGYWNGGIWIPHQYLIWKALLDYGRGAQAWKLAQAVIGCWERETAATYHCCEHFRVTNGRGAGWHQFSGLSSPLLAMHAAYHTPYTLTVGFDTWIHSLDWSAGCAQLEARLEVLVPGGSTAVVCLPKELSVVSANWLGQKVAVEHLTNQTIQLHLEAGNGWLRISAAASDADIV